MSLSKFLEKKVFYPGQKVFGEGDEGNRAYLVEKGLIEIGKLTPSGQEKVLGTVTTGGIFGEMALIDDQPRMATARALQETTCIIISREVFHEKLRKTDPFIQGLLKIFVRNIRNLSQEKMKSMDKGAPPLPGQPSSAEAGAAGAAGAGAQPTAQAAQPPRPPAQTTAPQAPNAAQPQPRMQPQATAARPQPQPQPGPPRPQPPKVI